MWPDWSSAYTERPYGWKTALPIVTPWWQPWRWRERLCWEQVSLDSMETKEYLHKKSVFFSVLSISLWQDSGLRTSLGIEVGWFLSMDLFQDLELKTSLGTVAGWFLSLFELLSFLPLQIFLQHHLDIKNNDEIKTMKQCLWYVQGSPFITLCLGSIELDHVISEPCYKGIIL